jgi:hypothetical protein
MSGSRWLVLAAALAVALGAPGCNRDYKAPKPRTGVLDSATLSASPGGGRTESGAKENP